MIGVVHFLPNGRKYTVLARSIPEVDSESMATHIRSDWICEAVCSRNHDSRIISHVLFTCHPFIINWIATSESHNSVHFFMSQGDSLLLKSTCLINLVKI